MDYFNFYFIKKLLSKLFTKKTLIYIIIFLIIIIIKSNVFAVTNDFPSNIDIQGYTFTFPTNNTNLNNAKNNFNYYLIQYMFNNYSTKSGIGYIFFTNTELCFKQRNNTWAFKGYNNESLTGSVIISFSFKNATNSNNITITSSTPISTSGQTYIPQQEYYSTYPSTTRNVTSPTANYYQYYTGNYSLNFVNSSGNVIDNVFSIEQDPFITTESTDISNWDFETLNIDLGTTQSPEFDNLHFTYNDKEFNISVSDYYIESQNMVEIPISDLNMQMFFVENATFKIEYYDYSGILHPNPVIYQLGLYNVSINNDTVSLLNNETDRTIQNNIYNEQQVTNEKLTTINETQQETNDKLDDLNNTLTDDTVESTSQDLPTISVTDPTQNGIDSIFQSIYNAFCVGQAQDIVFPIPFTNKSITLSPYYVRDMLNNNGAGWIYTLIQTFWAYLIGRYIVKDILNKITKIKSGNIENIENSNIKGDML